MVHISWSLTGEGGCICRMRQFSYRTLLHPLPDESQKSESFPSSSIIPILFYTCSQVIIADFSVHLLASSLFPISQGLHCGSWSLREQRCLVYEWISSHLVNARSYSCLSLIIITVFMRSHFFVPWQQGVHLAIQNPRKNPSE